MKRQALLIALLTGTVSSWPAVSLRAFAEEKTEEAWRSKAEQSATIKAGKVVIDKGEITIPLTIEWGKEKAAPKADEVTVVFVFQNAKEPVLTLNSTLLGKQGASNLVGLLGNGSVWVLRTAMAGEKGKVVNVLQVVGSDKKATADFRKGGEYTLKLQLSYAGNRDLPTGKVHVGLFQETDPKKWQQSSTSYKLLSNVIELTRK